MGSLGGSLGGIGGGTGLGNLIPLAMLVVAVVTILRNRRARRTRTADPDGPATDRRASALETERRMASYLAQRDTGHGHTAAPNDDGRENAR